MDEPHLAHAMRYVSLNPARARLVAQAHWQWSSVRAQLAGENDARKPLVARRAARFGVRRTKAALFCRKFTGNTDFTNLATFER